MIFVYIRGMYGYYYYYCDQQTAILQVQTSISRGVQGRSKVQKYFEETVNLLCPIFYGNIGLLKLAKFVENIVICENPFFSS